MTSTIANTTNITVVSVFLLTPHPLTRRRPSGQHSIKARTPRRISRPSFARYCVLLVRGVDSLHDGIHELPSLLLIEGEHGVEMAPEAAAWPVDKLGGRVVEARSLVDGDGQVLKAGEAPIASEPRYDPRKVCRLRCVHAPP